MRFIYLSTYLSFEGEEKEKKEKKGRKKTIQEKKRKRHVRIFREKEELNMIE